MIRAVVFDCFGVLASDGWLPFRREHFGTAGPRFEVASELNHRVDAGRMSYGEFVREVARLAEVSEVVVRRRIEHNVPDEACFAYIAAELKPRYRIGMLSNAAENWLDELFTPEQVRLFDAVALSYETGVIKPQAGAYRTIAERLGVPVEACVLVDDQPAYCEGARAVGMAAVRYVGVAELRTALADLAGR